MKVSTVLAVKSFKDKLIRRTSSSREYRSTKVHDLASIDSYDLSLGASQNNEAEDERKSSLSMDLLNLQSFKKVSPSLTSSFKGRMPSRTNSMEEDLASSEESKEIEKFSIMHEELKERPKYILSWNSKIRQRWDMLIVVCVIYLGFSIPVSLALPYWEMSNGSINVFIDIIFWIDIILNSRTGYIHLGQHITDPKEIWKHYLSTWFFIDLLGSLPLELMGSTIEKEQRKVLKVVKWLKIPKLLRLGRLFKYLKTLSRYERMLQLLIMSLFVNHLLGCCWLVIIDPVFEDCPEDALECVSQRLVQMKSLYVTSFYISWLSFFHVSDATEYISIFTANFTTNPTVTVGSNDVYMTDQSDDYTTFAVYALLLFMLIIGTSVVACTIGEVVVFARARTKDYDQFHLKAARIKREMIAQEVPMDLQYRVKRYLDYLWVNQHLNSNALLHDPEISLPLRKELALSIHGRFLKKLSLFKVCSPDCLFTIATKIDIRIFLPNDLIFAKGDVARELYFIRRGTIAINFGEVDAFDGARRNTMNQGKTDTSMGTKSTLGGIDLDKTRLMREGSYFGEIALLTSLRRTCSVFSVTVSNLCELTKQKFEEVLEEFPELENYVREQLVKNYPGLKEKIIQPRVTEITEAQLQQKVESLEETVLELKSSIDKLLDNLKVGDSKLSPTNNGRLDKSSNLERKASTFTESLSELNEI